MSSLVTYEPFVDNNIALISQHFSEVAGSRQAVDLAHWLQCYVFDMIGEIPFGSRFGFLDMGVDEGGVFKAIDQRGEYSTFVGIFPRIHQFLFPMLSKNGGHAYVAKFTEKQVQDRQSILKDPNHRDRRSTRFHDEVLTPT